MSLGRKSRSQVEKSRPAVYLRDGHICVVDGLFEAVQWPCRGSVTVQHRRGKGMGGSARGDAVNSLVAMCAGHNVLQTADARFAEACLRNGWAVPRWAADQHPMARIPVRYVDGWFLLDGDNRFGISEVTALELMSDVYGGVVE